MIRTLISAFFLALLAAVGISGVASAQVVTTVTGFRATAYSATAADCDPLGQRTIVMNLTVGSTNTILLPGAGLSGQAINGCKITIVNLQSGSLFVQGTTPDTINGQTNTTLAQRKSGVYISLGTPSSGTNSWVALGQ